MRVSRGRSRPDRYPVGKSGAPCQVHVPGEVFAVGTKVIIPQDELSHLRARRVRDGDSLALFNGHGDTALATLLGGEAIVKTTSSPAMFLSESSDDATQTGLHAIIALMKSPTRSDWLVEKLTELNTSTITFTSSSRTMSSRASNDRIARWMRVAVAAAKQSVRGNIPDIYCVPWEGCLDAVSKHSAAFVLCSGGKNPLSVDVTDRILKSHGAMFIVGPEGGLEENEIAALVEAGAEPLGLGALRLRIETAAVVTAAIFGQILGLSSSTGKDASPFPGSDIS